MSQYRTFCKMLSSGLKLKVIFINVAVCQIASAHSCRPIANQFRDLQYLKHQVALIGPDDRVERDSRNTPINIESAQLRIYCPLTPLTGHAAIHPKREDFDRVKTRMMNGTLAFDDDIVILPRHAFVDKDGKQPLKPTSCYVEQTKTGEILRVADGEWPAYDPNADALSHRDRDFALVKLRSKFRTGSHLRKEDIHIDSARNVDANVQVISNYGTIDKSKLDPFALTITNCKRKAFYQFASRAISNAAASDCDTGGGSSGSGAYLSIDSRPKLYGIVTAEIVKVPQGSAFDPKNLSTTITGFDNSLFDAYDRLRERALPAETAPVKEKPKHGR